MPIGGALYSFKLSEIADKVTAKDKATGTTVTARYKKDTKKFDVAYAAKYNSSLDYLLKYEEKQAGNPYYVAGCTYKAGEIMGANSTFDLKFNPFTGFLKGSSMMDFVKLGLVAAMDMKMDTTSMDMGAMKMNIGCKYTSPLGVTNVSYCNPAKLLTVSQYYDLDKKTAVCAEMVTAAPGTKAQPKCPMMCAVSYKVDKDHTVKVRVNNNMGIQCALEKTFMPGFQMLLATAMDGKDMGSAMSVPSFGIKVVCK